MSQITRLTIQQRDKERVNVYLDGEFAFGLVLEAAIRLKVGQQLTEEDIAALRDEDAYHKAHQRTLDFISRRPRSSQEVMRYLTKHEVAAPHIERLVARLTEVGLLNDLAFARYWIENRDTFRPKGAQAIRYELRQKGVNATIIDEALADSEQDETESAYRVAVKLLPRLRAIPDRYLFQRKLAAHLGRRGFGWDAIREVSERLWAARDEDDSAWLEP